MKAVLILGFGLGLMWNCTGEQVLAEFEWQKLAQAGQLIDGVPVEKDGRGALRITNANDTPLQAHLLKISKPPIVPGRLTAVISPS